MVDRPEPWVKRPVYLVACPICLARVNEVCSIRNGEPAYHPARYEFADNGRCLPRGNN